MTALIGAIIGCTVFLYFGLGMLVITIVQQTTQIKRIADELADRRAKEQ